jgi:predicted enzyme related to lactoylglutathione lyase
VPDGERHDRARLGHRADLRGPRASSAARSSSAWPGTSTSIGTRTSSGRTPCCAERAAGSRFLLKGFEIDSECELLDGAELFAEIDGVEVQVGTLPSVSWSHDPARWIGLASLRTEHAALTDGYVVIDDERVPCRIVGLPFVQIPRRRQVPRAEVIPGERRPPAPDQAAAARETRCPRTATRRATSSPTGSSGGSRTPTCPAPTLWRRGDWCTSVLGWTFRSPFTTPGGDYHLFAYSDVGGGGIRATPPGERPGSTPTVHVADTQSAYDAAIAAGAEPVSPPTKVMEGVCIAMVRAPGGVLIGLSGPTRAD